MKFLGTGSALPKKVVSNDDLAQVMDTSDEWIRSRTGIGMRHIAVEETTTSMAVEAAEKALADAKISGCEIDLIIAGRLLFCCGNQEFLVYECKKCLFGLPASPKSATS